MKTVISRRRLLRNGLQTVLAGGVGSAASFVRSETPGDNVLLLSRPDWKRGLTHIASEDGGYRVTQNYRNGTFSWAELHLTLDLDRYPEILVEVDGADANNRWCIKVQPVGEKEVWLLPETRECGTFVFPVGEYLDRYSTMQGIVRFFVVGNYGASVLLKRLELRGGGAQGVTERVEIDEKNPLQKMDGAGGQADYPLWTVGKDVDGVTASEIGTLLDRLQADGVSVARVGAYGEVIEAASSKADATDAALSGFVRHLQELKRRKMQTLFVAWTPPPHSRAQAPQSDAWVSSFVAHCADLISYCKTQNAPIDFFQPQNEPHANGNLQWWNPPFLGRCGIALADELVRRGLSTQVIGPDGLGEEWAAAWARAMGKRCPVVALKAGAGERGGAQETARTVARVMAHCQQEAGETRLRFWLTEYGSWAWGNADKDRRAENGPADGTRYGLAMAELTHYYLRAGIVCPSIWELYDVRRIDETVGKTPPEPPKRWGMFKYKTENWQARAHYATLGHYFRALQPGARLWAVTASGGLLPTAVSSGAGWNIVLTNRFRYTKRVLVRLPTGDWGVSGRWDVSSRDVPLQTNAVPLTQGVATVEVPPYGVGSLSLHRRGNFTPAAETATLKATA